ncbi:MAG: hypothetical protein QNJ20_15740 [Paracoccaceae bacterium]|nr:hypothetical protein [Paracoccaceae bacterium]
MRTIAACFCLASPAVAWEATSQGPICLLTHSTGEADITVSHDPREPLPYAIKLERKGGWVSGPVFVIRFDGPGRRTISTERHILTKDNTALTVTDKGFGNVLDGLALNHVAIAVTGETAVVIPLAGAAPEVEEFRSCTSNTGV